MKYLSVLVLAAAILSFSFDSKVEKKSDLDLLTEMMKGKFSSAQQAKNDTDYFVISLVMYPIWEEDQNYKWLYVEQAVASMPDKPYRQRVYRVSNMGKKKFESKVFELPNPEKFVFSWKDPTIYKTLKPNDLIERTGCAIILKKTKEGCFEGSTNKRDCVSDFRGASYASSIVSVCPTQLVSWDQGWNAEDEQVWGAEKGGYQFDKLESF